MLQLMVDLTAERLVSRQTGMGEVAETAGIFGRVRRWPLVTMGTIALAMLLALVPGASGAMELTSDGVLQGQLWRVFAGHLTHWSPEHLFWDIFALAIVGLICEKRGRGAMVVCMAVASIAISLAVLMLKPELSSYRGLSGVDSALFAMAAVYLLADGYSAKSVRAAILPVAALIAFAVKLCMELASGSAVFVPGSEMIPVPLAHLVGAACGAVCALVAVVLSRR